MTVGRPDGDTWQIDAPEPVGPPATLLARLRARAIQAPIALGIDCPLGVPRAYAAQWAPMANFPAFLHSLTDKPAFFQVAATLQEVSAKSPFYPVRGVAGMTRLAHALALGFDNAGALNRVCDQATPDRPAGAPVFWTLGANQSGKAALSAWRELLIPALSEAPPPFLWPFDGPYLELLQPGRVAVAETYPAEAMRHLGLKQSGSKRRRSDRAAYAQALLTRIADMSLICSPELHRALLDGFGPGEDGEDRFDSLLGVLCILNVIQGRRPDTAPADPWIQKWEGWVLGQTEPL